MSAGRLEEQTGSHRRTPFFAVMAGIGPPCFAELEMEEVAVCSDGTVGNASAVGVYSNRRRAAGTSLIQQCLVTMATTCCADIER
jgi:hypothetical protein